MYVCRLGAEWEQDFEHKFDPLNQELFLTVVVENKQYASDVGLNIPMRFIVKLFGRQERDQEYQLITSSTHTRDLSCEVGDKECEVIPILHEPFIRYDFYRVNVVPTGVTLDVRDNYLGNFHFSVHACCEFSGNDLMALY